MPLPRFGACHLRWAHECFLNLTVLFLRKNCNCPNWWKHMKTAHPATCFERLTVIFGLLSVNSVLALKMSCSKASIEEKLWSHKRLSTALSVWHVHAHKGYYTTTTTTYRKKCQTPQGVLPSVSSCPDPESSRGHLDHWTPVFSFFSSLSLSALWLLQWQVSVQIPAVVNSCRLSMLAAISIFHCYCIIPAIWAPIPANIIKS